MSDHQGSFLQPRNLSEAQMLAEQLATSDIIPKQYVGKPGNILVAMQYAFSLNLPIVAAMQYIYVANGKPSLFGDGLLAIVLGQPDCENVIERSTEDILELGAARCEVRRRGREPVIREFSIDDAKKAGLWGKGGPWSSYPVRMLQMRARGFALRDSYADKIAGLSIIEVARDDDAPPKTVHAEVVETRPQVKDRVRAQLAATSQQPVVQLSEVLAGIAVAETEAELMAVSTRARQLSETDKAVAKKAWSDRRAEIAQRTEDEQPLSEDDDARLRQDLSERGEHSEPAD